MISRAFDSGVEAQLVWGQRQRTAYTSACTAVARLIGCDPWVMRRCLFEIM